MRQVRNRKSDNELMSKMIITAIKVRKQEIAMNQVSVQATVTAMTETQIRISEFAKY